MTADEILTQLQPLSATPLHVLDRAPGRLTALGEIPGGAGALASRVARLGGVLVHEHEGSAMFRLDELGVVASCSWFGGLLLQQVRDVDRFVDAYLRDPSPAIVAAPPSSSPAARRARFGDAAAQAGREGGPVRRMTDVCCGASSKEQCTWAPCPANLDVYTPAELAEFTAYDTHRLDDAVAIYTGREYIDRGES